MLNKFFFILSIFLIHNVCAENITGKIISIADGDTATIINNNQQTKIRLAEIDTPEKNQPYGKKAKKALSDFIFNKEMVKAGHAWVYVQYAKDKTLFDLEKNAKENQLGLWALPEGERIAPWQWRRGKRSIEKESNLSFQCESKTTCRQMQSCAEARHYLINCGLTRLDRDKDGIPCESICR